MLSLFEEHQRVQCGSYRLGKGVRKEGVEVMSQAIQSLVGNYEDLIFLCE